MKYFLKVNLRELTLQLNYLISQHKTHVFRWPQDMVVSMHTTEMQTRTSVSDPRHGYLAREPTEEAPGEVEHVHGP